MRPEEMERAMHFLIEMFERPVRDSHGERPS